MVRRIAVMGVAVATLLLFTMGPAMADRLGGAYRGPYQDKITTKDDVNTEVGGAETGTAPGSGSAETGGGESGGGETGGGESGAGGAATQPPGEGEGGGEGEGEGGGAATEPPGAGEGEGEGGSGEGGASSEPGAPPPSEGEGGGSSEGGGTPAPPSNPGGSTGGGTIGGGGGSAGTGTPGGGKIAQEDVFAYWPFWFEHNKEWILAEILEQRGARARVPQRSSTWHFMGGSGRKLTPLTEEQKTKIVFPLLVECSKDPSSFVRDAAILALGKLGTEEAVAPIVARLEDPKERDQDIKEDALLALGLTRQKDALKPLMARLSDRKLKPFAALGLGLLGRADAVPVLLKEYKVQIRAKNADAAGCIAVALGLLGDESIVDELAAPIGMRSGIDGLNLYVCQALGRIGGEKAQKWLLRALKSRSKDVQAAAVLALSSFADKTVVKYLLGKDGLKAGDRMAKVFASVALGRIGSNLDPKDPVRKQVRLALKEIVENPEKDKYAAMYASLAIAIMGENASNKFFEEQLDTDNRPKYSPENYSAMALSSGLLENKKTVRYLRDILTKGSFEPDYRGYAAFALGIMGDLESKDAIREGIERNKRRQELVRSGCWALGLIGDREDLDLLISLLKKEVNNKHQARGAAAVAVGLVGDGSAVEKLMKIVKEDHDTSNRAFAVAALGCLIDAEPVPRIPQLFMNVHYREESRLVKDVLMNL